MTKEYRDSRESFVPVVGEWYTNQGGGVYCCMKDCGHGAAIMRNISSGWTMLVHGLGMYSDHKIDWDYSTGGYYI